MPACAFELPVNFTWISPNKCHAILGCQKFDFGRVCQRLSIYSHSTPYTCCETGIPRFFWGSLFGYENALSIYHYLRMLTINQA